MNNVEEKFARFFSHWQEISHIKENQNGRKLRRYRCHTGEDQCYQLTTGVLCHWCQGDRITR